MSALGQKWTLIQPEIAVFNRGCAEFAAEHNYLMARIPTSGETILSYYKLRTKLDPILVELCPGCVFDESVLDEIFWRLGSIAGAWIAERERLETRPLARALARIGRKLSAFSVDSSRSIDIDELSGHETGLRISRDIETVSALAAALAKNPDVGSIVAGNHRIATFLKNPTQTDAAILATACIDAADDLRAQVGRSGRPKLDWYDDFTKLLLEIADKANIKPTFWKDRTTDERRGWLFETAQCLESFLHQDMRSPDGEACGKRLETSQKRLKRRP